VSSCNTVSGSVYSGPLVNYCPTLACPTIPSLAVALHYLVAVANIRKMCEASAAPDLDRLKIGCGHSDPTDAMAMFSFQKNFKIPRHIEYLDTCMER
jgi:hypothetical protein